MCACFHAEACQPGQQRFGGSCYQLLNKSMTWDQGDAACLEMGTALAVPEFMDEQKFIYKMYGKSKDLWIGCNDKEQEGKIRKAIICQSPAPLATPKMFCLQRYADARSSSHCLTGHVIKEFSATGVIACGSACRDEPRCRSFNLRRGDPGVLICQLNNITRFSAIHDFTCITKPRIDIGSEETYIAAFLHGGNATLSFARTTYTYTSVDNDPLGLPSDYRLKPRPSSEGDEIFKLRLPAAGGMTRIGAFACNARMTDRNDSIGTIIMSRTADFLPTRVSQTVNRGDVVNLTVISINQSRTSTRWRKDGGGVITDLQDDLYSDFVNARVSDIGIYEVHLAGERSHGNQALMQLIVRACPNNKWNAPSCDRHCPVCFNGGMCDDRSGDCICPPGFSGEFCKRPIGPNRFGQSGSFRCDLRELGGRPTCAGMLFCLPNPYGCSCAAGYQGIDCNETCADGFYGADCAQTCHCMDGVACDGTTGECRGDCAPGFIGINCQVPDAVDGLTVQGTSYNSLSLSWDAPGTSQEFPCPASDYLVTFDLINLEQLPAAVSDISILAISRERNEFDVRWTSPDGACPATSYSVTYELITMDQCTKQNPPIVTDVGKVDTTHATLHLPAYYSEYRVNVSSINEAGHGETKFVELFTSENTPIAAPVTRSTATYDSITFSWDPIPCGSRRGNITHYAYAFRGPRPQEEDRTIDKRNISELSVTLHDLSPCTTYSIRVRAYTRIGAGPWTNWTHQDTILKDDIQSLTLEPSRNGIRVTWTSTRDEGNLCPASSYRVSYQLLNLEQCQPQTDSAPIHAAVVNSSGIELTSMHAYSTYSVRVEPGHHPGEDFSERKTVTTDEGVPLAAPEVDSVSSSNQITRVSWHPIPCGKRDGDITGYTYELRDASGSMIQTADTTAESVEVDGLSQGASYSFRLWASTRVGPGPWIEFSMVIIKVDSGSSVANTVFSGGVGIAIGIILATAVALLMAFARHYRKRSQRAKRSASRPMPESRAHDDADAIYFDINDDIELKKISATPSRESATGASTVPSGKSTTRALAPRASTKRSTATATKKPQMAAGQSGARHYENTVIP
ncbi:tyrosine-protein kinase receptor Tie-1-like [Patiria miniata]|uniref:Uncharacterized protein n=1 Tax=Patiria miniata TaxID=46514 RepID=A0A914ASB2_PATMI|nr:tyrosine-protein kinase receptor Tie-1-like [Patiria miniata]